MVIDIAVLDYIGGKVRLVSCDVPANHTKETIEGELELIGYDLDAIHYMVDDHIELLDEREAH